MKSIVTGGGGFIGSHLVDGLLRLNHKVLVLDNFSTGRIDNLTHVLDQIQVLDCDIGKPGEWVEAFEGVDWVFHLAALADIVPSIQRPDEYFRSNVDGTFNVLRACQMAKNPRVVYAASSSCYGIPDIYPTPETAEIRPQYPYALTKHLGEQLVLHWAQVYKLPTISLRFFNVYG
ncbi:MAG: NAD-dependent epimerase/dehydratase family protein, partial [Chloroflexota bacterium]|nr:NAD-dependent epimerase/dehydratase family protein [Chloroflexota bacterium]